MPTIAALCQAGELATAYHEAKTALLARPDNQFVQADMHLVVLSCAQKCVAQHDAAGLTKWLGKLPALGLPAHVGREEQLFWEIWKLLRDFSKHQHPPYADIAALLAALVRWPVAAVASVGRSRLLQMALKFREQLPAAWWAWWNLELLRPEDFVKGSFTPKGGDKAIRLPAVAETAFGAYAKSLVKRLAPAGAETGAFGRSVQAQSSGTARAEALTLLPQIEILADAHPDYGWLGYYRAKLLVTLGDTAAALPTLLPLVRQKSTEYWAWQLLGETLRPTDPAAALACYYRATQGGTEEMYLGPVRETLAGLLHEAGHLAEAQQQLQQLALTKQAEGKQPGYAARQLMAQPWFEAVHTPTKGLAATLLDAADTAAYGDLLWQPVVLLEHLPATAEKPARVRLQPAGRRAKPLTVKLKKFNWLSKLPLGAPLQVRCDVVQDFTQAVQVAKRPDGQAWDVHPDPAQASSEPPKTKEFAGSLRVQATGFGFVDDVFVPARLITQNGWQSGQQLRGTARSQFDEKKGKDGWVLKQAILA